MQLTLVLRTLGILLLIFAAALVPPLLVAVLYADGHVEHFGATIIVAAVAGLSLWIPNWRARTTPKNKDGFVIVTLSWMALCVLGSLPFMLGLGMGFPAAVFESTSGFTTTGSTVLVGLDALAPSVLFYRQELQWLGGVGVIITAIALMPMLGVGGMQLFKAETPGPIKDEKFTPRIANTARAIWKLYLVLTCACALLYWFAGMSIFDSIAHSFSTVSTGGFSTHDASMAYFDSPAVEAIAIVFMSICAVSFGLHVLVWQDFGFGRYRRDSQTRLFVGLMVVAIWLTAAVLWLTGTRAEPLDALRASAFEVVSVQTSTGFGVDDFAAWPLATPVLLIFLSFVGGCAGSTAGGMKALRFVVIGKQASIQIHKLIHPRSVTTLKMGGRMVPPEVVDAVWAFFAIYVITFALLMLLVMSDGLDQVTAFGAVATCINNLGPGLGEVAGNFLTVGDASKLVLAFAMVLGRLEIFTVMVLVSPEFWRT